jgi:hypothetical protein
VRQLRAAPRCAARRCAARQRPRLLARTLLSCSRPRTAQRPALVKGNMQLFSVEQQRSQALEAHAAVFGTLKVRHGKGWQLLGSAAADAWRRNRSTRATRSRRSSSPLPRRRW